GERVQRRVVPPAVVDVHVLGPVGEADALLLRGVVLRRDAALGVSGRGDAAGAERPGAADRQRAAGGGAQQGPAGQGRPAVAEAAPHGGHLGRGKAVGLVLLHARGALSGGGRGSGGQAAIGPRRRGGAKIGRAHV